MPLTIRHFQGTRHHLDDSWRKLAAALEVSRIMAPRIPAEVLFLSSAGSIQHPCQRTAPQAQIHPLAAQRHLAAPQGRVLALLGFGGTQRFISFILEAVQVWHLLGQHGAGLVDLRPWNKDLSVAIGPNPQLVQDARRLRTRFSCS